jgi:peroxiredoxin
VAAAPAGVALGMALLLSTSAQPAARPGGANGICDAKGGTANLDFTLRDINGGNVPLSAYKGKVILLDFWATWCPPCRKGIPGFVELYDKYKSRGFVVLGVSVDDSLSDVKKFVKKFNMNYPVIMGAGREDLQRAFGGPLAFPTAFIIARDGAICSQHTGLAPLDLFERKIRALL